MVNTNSNVSERRRCVRIKDLLPTRLQFIDGDPEPKQACVENIGESGACLTTNLERNKVKKDVYFKIDLSGASMPLDIAGVVVWVKQMEESVLRIGIKFSGVPVTTQGQINKYIQSKLENKPLAKKIKKIVFKREPLNKLSERERRNLVILDALRKRGPLSKAQVSQIADLNIGTITNYVEAYIKEGLVQDMGLDVSSGGRRPTLLELNPQYGFCVGIDMSNKNKGLVALTCDIKGKIIKKYESASQSENEFKRDNLFKCVSEMVNSSSGPDSIIGIGIATQDSVDKNLLDLTQDLEEEFDVPVLLESASCSGLFAEKIMNPSLDEIENILYFSLRGSDCGLFINGDIFRISSKFAINMNVNAESGKANCWIKEKNCLLRPLPDYEQGDTQALTEDLGARLSVLTNILCPNVIILADVDDKDSIRDLLSEIRDSIKGGLVYAKTQPPKISLGHFSKESAALGAALLVSREIFIQA